MSVMDILTLIGYIASATIATSMVMNSILKLRWINLFGALMFATYGYIIGALPVGILNSFIVSVDIYYLIKIYSRKEYFTTLDIRSDNKYLLAFLDFYKNEIDRFFPGFKYKPELNTISFLILRNMAVAGIVLGRQIDKKTLYISLDFAIPEYRDFKLGNYIYLNKKNYFTNLGYEKICFEPKGEKFIMYLIKMGFSKQKINSKTMFVKQLNIEN